MNKHAKENLRGIIHMAKDKSANQYFMDTGRHPTDDIVELAEDAISLIEQVEAEQELSSKPVFTMNIQKDYQ